MLKWMVPPRSDRDSSSSSSSHRSSQSSGLRVTEDPLAAFSSRKQQKGGRYGKLPLSFGTSGRRGEEEIYSVTRVNPLFQEGMLMSNKEWNSQQQKKFRFLVNDHGLSRNSRSESSASSSRKTGSPTSSGYESWMPIDKVRADEKESKKSAKTTSMAVKPKPNSDYRRQFVLGVDDRSAAHHRKSPVTVMSDPMTLPRIGKASIIHQNPQYVTRVQMSDDSVVSIWKKSLVPPMSTTIQPKAPAKIQAPPPRPIWPLSSPKNGSSPPNSIQPHQSEASLYLQPTTDTIIEQNENYVTKITISPEQPTPEQQQHQLQKHHIDGSGLRPELNHDSIITDSLLMWMSYEESEKDDGSSRTKEPSPLANITDSENAAAIGQLSQTISRSRTVATVSRAFSTRLDFNTISSDGNKSMDRRNSASNSHSMSKGFSMVKDFWGNGVLNNGRRLLVESDEDEEQQRIMYRHAPLDLTTNYRTEFERYSRNPLDPNLHTIHSEASLHHIVENHFAHDRRSHSSHSSSSSGSRRVTFSADTVDNEPLNLETNAFERSASSPVTSVTPVTPLPSCEIHLNPIHLPHYRPDQGQSRSHHIQQSAKEMQVKYPDTSKEGRHNKQHYYTSNLKICSSDHRSVEKSAREATVPVATCTSVPKPEEKQKMWGSYYGAFSQMEPHGNLQLHPNHPTVCPDSSVCLDFTLDSGNISLIQRKSANEKLRRRLCCFVLFLLIIGIVLVVVVGISLYLTHGQRYFGPI